MKTLLHISIFMLFTYSLSAQVGIGTDNPDTNTVLHVETASGNKGMLIPRINTGEMRNMVSPNLSQGTLVYNTDSNEIYAWFDNAWNSLTPFYRKRDNIPVGPGEIKASAYPQHKRKIEGGVPVGGIIMWSGHTPPDGWALCNGQTVNGFKTPDLKGRFVAGWDGSGTLTKYGIAGNLSQGGVVDGVRQGVESNTLTVNNVPSHTHGFSGTTVASGNHNHYTLYNLHGGGGNPGDFGTHHYALRGSSHDNGDPDEEYQMWFAQFVPNVGLTNTSGNHTHTYSGTTSAYGKASPDAIDNRPPYYVLAYIIRIK